MPRKDRIVFSRFRKCSEQVAEVELHEKDGCVLLPVRAQPRSSRSRLCGEYSGSLKIALRAAPVDDAANRECCVLLGKVFGVAASRLSVIAGRSSRNKIVRIEGVSAEDVARILEEELSGS
ncbi:MAG: DUF167 domain-containing protein [Chlorobium sp.]|nr:DUF167 domain-containing protein [Chlorobium sp.]MCF8270998.1 DUF167 domain-containing protein [Chlorobium sp.]MCF8287356.1 DUF167 domain-containing protein [Chlorobium sp.]MCF8290911.1 DUF167 domain-containing protein [Chlorobium sp.]MCF8385006.1 DUF167 domain-containing protein [Chlorobium sp.]